MSLLKITVTTKESGVVIVTLAGSIDSESYTDLEKRVEPILKKQLSVMVFDMKRVAYVSSMGISAILKARKVIEAGGGHLLLVNLQPQITKLFDIMKILMSKDIFKNSAELDLYLASILKRSS